MALWITDDCINCDVCEPECPNEAIFMGPEIYEINPDRCTECVGHFDTPQCVQICPVNCIPVRPDRVESKDQLMEKYRQLTAAKTPVSWKSRPASRYGVGTRRNDHAAFPSLLKAVFVARCVCFLSRPFRFFSLALLQGQ